MKILAVITSVFFCSFSLHAQNTFPTGSGTYAGIGVTSPSTALHIRKNITSLHAGNFITIENRGSNATYTTSHTIGGLLFSGYSSSKTPANVAGIWAVRSSVSNGVSSSGDIVFGATNTPLNIASDNALPTERMRLTNDGRLGIGTAAPRAYFDVANTTPGLSSVLSRLEEGNTTDFAEGTFLGVRSVGTSPVFSNSFSIEHRFYGQLNSSINFYRGANTQGGFLTFATGDGTERIRIDQGGALGVGTTAPEGILHVRSNVGNVDVVLETTSGNSKWDLAISEDTHEIKFYDKVTNNSPFIVQQGASENSLYITQYGNVLIGKNSQSNQDYRLDIGGPLRADKVVVNTTGADFVFDSSYNLQPLKEVEQYVKTHKHLPGVDPAINLQKDGIDLGTYQTKLLQKVEELTLYLIEQKKQIDYLRGEITQMQTAGKKANHK